MISGQQTINIGFQNEAAGSDSLYTAFNKTKDNFTTLFACASPYNTFTGNTGIRTDQTTPGTVDITNTGVVNIVAGTNIVVTPKDVNGNVTISSTGGGGSGGTVTSVGLVGVAFAGGSPLVVGGSPIISSGTMTIDLPQIPGVAGTNYTYPTVTVDSYGRITSIANATNVGTVYSVGVVPGAGIQATGGPITSSGSITITNTGVISLNAGTGIQLSGNTGAVTISSTITQNPGTVTSVGLTSSTLTVTPMAITTNGVLAVNLSDNVPVTGILTLSGKEILADGDAASLTVTTSLVYPAGNNEENTLSAGVEGQIKIFIMGSAIGNRTVWVTPDSGLPNGGFKLDSLGGSVMLQFINGTWFCIGNNGADFGPFA